MRVTSPHPNRRRPRPRGVAVVACAATFGGAIAGCSSGDGRDLEPPVFPLPATTTVTTTTLAALPGADVEPTDPIAAPLRLVAPWRDGAAVPIRHTCDGDDVSPALSWSNVPVDAVEVALTVTDLDAPDFVHWLVTGIDVEAVGTAEGAPPAGARVWHNSGGEEGYAGPCPPPGPAHRYLFTVHALNQQLEAADEMTAAEVVEILNLTSIDQSSVSGTHVRTE